VDDDARHTVWSARLDPYGAAIVSPNSQLELPIRFPGHYHDKETGLHYNWFRYYSPELGRYIQADPLGIEGGINLFAYVENPLIEVDIDGLAAKKCGKKGTKKKTPKKKPKKKSSKKKAAKTPKKPEGVVITLKKPEGVSDAEWKAKLKALNDAAKNGKAKVVHNPVRDGKAQKQARKEGKIKKGHDADHSLDLQFGGDDKPSNIRSTPSRVNRSVGGQGQQRMQHPHGTPIRKFVSDD